MKPTCNHRSAAARVLRVAAACLCAAAFCNPAGATAARALHAAASAWLQHDPARCLTQASLLSIESAPQAESAGLFWMHRCADALELDDLATSALSALARRHPSSFHGLAAIPQIDPPSAADPRRSGASLLAAMLEVESSFDQSAVSPKNATGIAQVLPTTAADILNKPAGDPQAMKCLRDEACNTSLGAVYLRTQLAGFTDLAAAIYAYNAGPSRAGEWIRDRPADPIAAIDTIPIGETRRHIRRLLANLWLRQLRSRTWSVSRHAIHTGHWPAAP